MIRNALIALTTTAVVAVGSIGAAQAHGFKHNHGFNKRVIIVNNGFGYSHCKFVTRKVFIGYSHFGKPIYKFKRVRICF